MKIKNFNLVVKRLMMWNWEMAQQIKALAALPGDPSSVPSTQVKILSLFPMGAANTSFWLPWALIPCARVYTEIYTFKKTRERHATESMLSHNSAV